MFGGSIANAVQAINHSIQDFLLYFDEEEYSLLCMKFIHSWYSCHADCENPSSFLKLQLFLFEASNVSARIEVHDYEVWKKYFETFRSPIFA